MHVHSCSEGFTTARARAEWLREHGLTLTDDNSGLVADPDPKAPLYFWQLHSLLGWRRIEGIVRAFYERVYADTGKRLLTRTNISTRIHLPDIECHLKSLLVQ